ncbi:MAG: redoxin domain-containing protein [Thermoplasmata archaeon]|nr:redoxin domain-containing protein [Thermoplasmata archaeon]
MAKNALECPVCGITVKVENVEAHLRKVHPGKKVDIDELDLPRVRKPKKATAVRGGRTWQKWVALIVVLIVVAVVVVLVLPPGEEEEEPNYAPNFEVNDAVDGDHFSLNLNIGPKPILIEFFNPNEEDSQEMASNMTNVSAAIGSSVTMVSLSVRMPSELSYFRGYYGADWTYAHAEPKVFQDYGISQLPTYVLVDKKGIIRWIQPGLILTEDLINLIEPWT